MSWIEQRLDELAQDGYFDDLSGSGAPLPGLGNDDPPNWWARRWMERDAARRDAGRVINRLAADIAAALELPRGEARSRLESIKEAVDAVNRLLDGSERLPDIDVDRSLIWKRWES